MPKSVPLVALERAAALRTQWVATGNVVVQVDQPERLGRLAYLDTLETGTVGRLGQRSARNVVLVQAPDGNPVRAALWVRSSYGGYRDAYLAFLKAVYGYPATATKSVMAGYDADHLLNRARAPSDTTFVRLELVPSAVNQAWGYLFEQAASHPGFTANTTRETRSMSYMIFAKVMGQMPPDGPNDTGGIARLVDFLVSVGIDRNEAETGLRSMLTFAYSLRT